MIVTWFTPARRSFEWFGQTAGTLALIERGGTSAVASVIGQDGDPGPRGATGPTGATGEVAAPTFSAEFTPLTGQPQGAIVESNAVTATGRDDWLWPLVARGGEVQINAQEWGPNGAIRTGDTVKMRLTTAGTGLTETVASLYGQGFTRLWSVETGSVSPFTPASLFAGGEQGAWCDPSDLDTLFQDAAGTTPVTAAGQSVGKMLDKSGRANHATQAISAARPTYQVTPDRLTIDKVDDRLITTVPDGGFVGTMILGTDQGTASYGVNISAGAYDIGGRGGQYFPGNAIVGQLIRDGALTTEEAAAVEADFVEKGATASYGAVTSFNNYWQNWSEITSFPLIDTSSGTSFIAAWPGCTNLTSFPLIDTSSGTDFSFAWYGCTSLTSFPLIDTSSGTSFSFAWYDCTSLTSFPANIFDSVKGGNFSFAFTNTALAQTSIDNILVSLVASGIATGTRVFDQSGGSTPSSTGEAAITTLRSRGWTVTVTGGL